jgi:putative transcriptional regulator
MDALAGRLLVATPALSDGVFDRTVVLLLDHNAEGALGVVLNRPSATPVEEALPRWAARAAEPPVVFVGGPVNQTAAICVAKSDEPSTEGWQPLIDGLGTLDLGRDPDEVPVDIDWLRIYAGYSGWAGGQLEGEIEAGAWFVVEAQPADPVSARPKGLWREVLHRQPGLLSSVANMPEDLSTN